MNIYQVLPFFAYGDAIGNDTIALHNIIQEVGYHTHIYTENVIGPVPKEICSNISELKEVADDDVIIYHLSTGSEMNYQVATFNCRLIVIYHNITPSEYFNGYSRALYRSCKQGKDAVNFLKDKVDYVLADSEYNKKELQEMGYQCDIDVLPILIPYEDYDKKPNKAILEKYQDGRTNIIFTGRIAPNKKQEDVIAAFSLYKKYYNSDARLFLVGSYSGTTQYYEHLKQYVKELGVEDVVFTGHIPFDEILAYYHVADCFLCMSEHEGFCVPLVEAMYFNIPIIAYDSSAIGYTLGNSGWLLKEKEPAVVAGVMNRVLIDEDVRNAILSEQRKRLAEFGYSKTGAQFIACLQAFISENE